MKKLVFFLLSIIFFALPVAWAGDRYYFSDPSQAQRFNQLTQQFRCLVCQNEDLASSNAALAEDLRQQIYQMIQAGKSNQEITKYMVNRYGDFVLFKPPFMGATVFIWILPFLLLAGGTVVFYFVVRFYRR